MPRILPPLRVQLIQAYSEFPFTKTVNNVSEHGGSTANCHLQLKQATPQQWQPRSVQGNTLKIAGARRV